MSSAVHERLPEELGVFGILDDGAVGLFVLVGDEAVAGGMEREDGAAVEVAVEDDVLSQVRDRIWVGGDARGGIQGGEVGIQAEACLGVEAPYLGKVGRVSSCFL